MEKILILSSQENQRTFNTVHNGQQVAIKAIDLVLTDGINMFLATAYDKEAQKLIDNPVQPGAWLNVDLTFTVRTVKTENGDKAFQQIRINRYARLA